MKDWEPRLVAYLASTAGQPFQPGALDCALFVAGALQAMTSVDHASPWRGRYKSLKAGRSALKKAGYADHVALVASLTDADGELLFKEFPPAFAHKGDIAVVAGSEGMDALGIVQGEGIYVLKPEGLAVVRRSEMKRAFRV